MVIGLPDRLASTVAPARASPLEGGTGTNMSSQISTPMVRPRHIGGLEQQVGAERRPLPGDGDLQADDAAAGGELAPLVELAVVRQVDLGHDAEDPTAVDDHGGVEQPRPVPKRCADDDHRQQVGTGGDDGGQTLVHRVEHGVLAEQVVQRVAGQGQLGEHGDRDAGLGQPPTDVDDALRVAPRIGDVDVGGARGDPGEPVRVQRGERHAVILAEARSAVTRPDRAIEKPRPAQGMIGT